MKLYIKATSTYLSDEELDIKKELKQRYKLDTRRQDSFIHLAVLGAQRLKDITDIKKDDELYLTSGVGNIDVIQRINRSVYEEKQFIKPFDFINTLGNTTSYYVATSLGIKGKNIFQISDNFTYINSLISIYSSLSMSKKEAIFGCVDLVSEPDEILKRVLGISENCELVSGVNYQKLSVNNEDSISEIEFDTKFYTLDEIKEILKDSDKEIFSSFRCSEIDAKKESKFFETELSYVINKRVESKKDMIYIDCFNGRYKILRLKSLR